MKIQFSLPVGPFSINAFYYARRKIITAEAREWQHRVIYAASAPGITDKMKLFRDEFDQKKHSIAFSVVYNVPATSFYTKNGTISGHVFDCTNFEKPLLDLLMLPKFHGNESAETFLNLNMDDKHVTRISSEKRPVNAGHESLDITFEILPKPCVHDNSN